MSKKRSNRRSASVSTPPLTPRVATPKIIYNPYQQLLITRALTREAAPNVTERTRRNYTRQIIDRRFYHPDRNKPPGALKRKYSRLIATKHFGVGFAVPNRVAVCARRKTRREVLHALRRTGRNGVSYKRRRNEWSDVKC